MIHPFCPVQKVFRTIDNNENSGRTYPLLSDVFHFVLDEPVLFCESFVLEKNERRKRQPGVILQEQLTVDILNRDECNRPPSEKYNQKNQYITP